MNKGCRDAQMAVFFFFHEAGEGVGMERMLCWWLAELLLVVGGASVCDWWNFCWRKNKAFVWGDSKVLFVVKKRSFLPNALWNAFFFL
ncbi:hypothetical protein NXX95_22420 [Bacteroides xylanisolvens]|uniref:hypothetical protein n=1 Tax=Bacteroides xylanisolvens TaxID=371601 RepID=UPI002161864D|nr:hypothetical protein [Bacteroides xylanisolvens]UVP23721.1 hypothetical protein NXX95_22420 [Bacteroides xylanisolvens]